MTAERGIVKRFVLGIALITFLSAATVATAGLLEVGQLAKDIDAGGKVIKLGDEEVTAATAGAPQTILVLGSDRRVADKIAGTRGQSDTILLIRLDPHNQATSIMSIPRDLKVNIPGRGVDRINKAYLHGGPGLTVKTVKELLATTGEPFKINHVINVNFRGFRKAVDYVGCVYGDIDRRYFNPQGGVYATIDIKPGYQRLCGQEALDYVRYRHTDNDIVRAARQQDFLRQAKAQVGVKKLFERRRQLTKLFGRYTESDRGLHSSTGILTLLKLAAFSASKPVREVSFPAIIPEDPKDTFLDYEVGKLHSAVTEFMEGRSRGPVTKATPPAKKPKKRKRRKRVPAGLQDARKLGEDQGIVASQDTPFPVYYPTLAAPGAQYADQARTYNIRDLKGKKYRSYRIVAKSGEIGEYYGVQGMNWTNPPILDDAHDTKVVNGRTFHLYYDGKKLRLVAWRLPGAVYWVTNTLTRTLSNKQMLGLAGSLKRAG